MRSIINSFMLLVFCAALPALAQSEKGDIELQLQGTLTIGLESGVDDSGSAFLNIGRFATNSHEFGVSVLGTFNSDGDLGGFGGPFWRCNFGRSKTVPFIGVAAYTSFGDSSGSDFLVNLEGGIRWYLERNMAFSLSGTTFYDVDESDFVDSLNVLFGFSYFFD